MTDQELKKIADELSKRLWSGQHDLNGMKEEINFTLLKVQSQVRNTQSCSRNQRATQFCLQAEELAGKLAMLEANEAVQNALITDLKNYKEGFEKKVKLEIIASTGPTFGAYCRGECGDGEAAIVLDLKLCLANDKNPKGFLAEVLAHEVLHACQDILGAELTESDINAALASLNGEEYISCESEEQIQQEQLRIIQDQGEKLKIAVDELERIQYLLGEKDFDLIGEVLEKIKEG